MGSELFIIVVMYLLGGITLASGYYVYTSVKIKRAYENMLHEQSHLQTTQMTQFQKWVGKNLEIENLIKEVESQLKDDGYASQSEINKKINRIEHELKSLEAIVNGEKRLLKDTSSGVFAEINQLKNSIRKLAQDPNFLQRY